ncbi:glycosyltransferase family 39 protein [bacterium]|nr:glycosyltransferase family 39 protein [bacterium]
MASNNKSKTLIMIFIFLYALVLDIVHIHFTFFMEQGVPTSLENTPSSPFWLVDSVILDKSARDFLEGKKIDSGIPFRPPLYIIILAFLYKLTSSSYFAAKMLNSILLSSSCVFIYLIGSILLGELTGLITSILWASSFGRIMMAGSLNNEALYIFLTTLIIYILIKKDLMLTNKGYIALGFLSGLAMLTRSEYQLFIILILFLLIFKIKNIKEFLKKGGLIIVAAFIVILPWMIRNYITISVINKEHGYGLCKFVPVTAYGGLNFATANNEIAEGGFSRNILESLGPFDTEFSFDKKQHLHFFKNGYKEGLNFFLENPEAGLELIFKKLIILSDALSFGYLTFDFPSGLHGFRRYVDAFYPEDKLSFLINIILLCIGLALLIIDKKLKFTFLPVFALIFTTLTANILFFGYVRLGLTVVPFLLIFIAYPIAMLISALGEMIKLSRIQKVIIPVSLFIGILCICIFMASKSMTLKTEDIEGGKFTSISYHTSF